MAYFVNKSFEPERKVNTLGKTPLYSYCLFRTEISVWRWPGAIVEQYCQEQRQKTGMEPGKQTLKSAAPSTFVSLHLTTRAISQ